MGENDLQNQIVQVLATVLGALKQEELELALLMMDEEGRNQLIQFVASAVQLGQVDDNTLSLALQLAKLALQKGKARKAEFGAKLEYIKKLQGGGNPRRTRTTPHSVDRAKRSVGVDSFGNKRRIDTIEGRYGGIPTTLIRTITEYPAEPGFIGEPLIHPSDTNIMVKTPYGKYQGDAHMFNELYKEDPATFDLEMVVNTTRRDRARNAANERKYRARRAGNQNKNNGKNNTSNILGTAMTLINPALGLGTMIGNNIRKALGFKKGGTLIPKHLQGNPIIYSIPFVGPIVGVNDALTTIGDLYKTITKPYEFTKVRSVATRQGKGNEYELALIQKPGNSFRPVYERQILKTPFVSDTIYLDYSDYEKTPLPKKGNKKLFEKLKNLSKTTLDAIAPVKDGRWWEEDFYYNKSKLEKR